MYDNYEDYDGQDFSENDRSVEVVTAVTVEWDNATVIKGVVEKVAGMVYEDIKPQVEEAIFETLDDEVNEAVLALMDKEVQITDKWGDPTGEPESVRALLMRDTEKWLLDQVDSSGRKSKGYYGGRRQRIHWLIQQALDGPKVHHGRGKTELQKMIERAIKEVVGDVQALVDEEVKRQVAERFAKAR